jgi:hypothetical protein
VSHKTQLLRFVLPLKVWRSTFRPPQTAAYAARCGLLLLRRLQLLTLAEVAGLLHCSKAHVSNVVAGKVRGIAPLPAVPLGRRKLVRRQTLANWIDDNEHSSSDTIQPSPDRGRKNA